MLHPKTKNPNLMKVTYAWKKSIKAVFTPLLTEAYPPKRHDISKQHTFWMWSFKRLSS